MNSYIALAIVLGLIVSGTYVLRNNRKTKATGPLILYYTKKGIHFINKTASLSPRFWKVFSTIGIAVSFFFMVYIFIALAGNTLSMFIKPEVTQAGAVPVIPGVTIPFWFGIIALITVLLFHELSHGIVARAEKIKIKSVGTVSLGFLPLGAFVEPNEKELKRSRPIKQLRMYAAGSFMNIVMAFAFALLITHAVLPAFADAAPGIHVMEITKGSPAEAARLTTGTIIRNIGGISVASVESFKGAVKDLKPGNVLDMETDRGTYHVMLGEKEGKGYMGINVIACTEKAIHEVCYPAKSWANQKILWFAVGTFNWIVVLNFGIGLFNLLPLKPFDGGLMLDVVLKKYAPSVNKQIIRGIGIVSVFMILINVFGPYLV